MAGSRPPVPMSQVSEDLDDGTLALIKTPAPGPVGVANAPAQAAPPPPVQGWPSQLTWSQFRTVASPPDGGTEQAQTATNQPAIAEISVEKHGKDFLLGPFTLTVELDSDNCWVVKGQTSAALLRHEQVHWDIAGLTAYEISRTLKALRALHVPGLKADVDATMKRLATKAQALQLWYDDESKHGLNAAGQKAWEDRIAEAIKNQNAALPNPPEKYWKQARESQH